jgi:hypothetical protein
MKFIPGNTYKLLFKNRREVIAEYTTIIGEKLRFVICDSATLLVCPWDLIFDD